MHITVNVKRSRFTAVRLRFDPAGIPVDVAIVRQCKRDVSIDIDRDVAVQQQNIARTYRYRAWPTLALSHARPARCGHMLLRYTIAAAMYYV